MAEVSNPPVGVVLGALGVIATSWLAVAGRLTLYIHPRYVTFTVVMAVLAAVMIVAGRVVGDSEPGQHHGSVSDRRRRGWAAALIGFWFVALLAAPPSALSASTAEQRHVNQVIGSTSPIPAAPTTLDGADYRSFRLRDWAVAIQLASSPTQLAGRRFEEIGFVSAVDARRPDLFYVTRFIVTCCTVDAQPVGVPVYLPQWEKVYAKDSWVRVKGRMGVDPKDADRSVVMPRSIRPIDQPDDPYRP